VYEAIVELFGFFHNMLGLSPMSLRASAQNLMKAYRKDLEPSLDDELIQFICQEPCNSASLENKQLRTCSLLFQVGAELGVRE